MIFCNYSKCINIEELKPSLRLNLYQKIANDKGKVLYQWTDWWDHILETYLFLRHTIQGFSCKHCLPSISRSILLSELGRNFSETIVRNSHTCESLLLVGEKTTKKLSGHQRWQQNISGKNGGFLAGNKNPLQMLGIVRCHDHQRVSRASSSCELRFHQPETGFSGNGCVAAGP